MKIDDSAIPRLLETPPQSPEDWGALLDEILALFACVTGTIHVLDPGSGMLKLIAHRGIPEELMAVVTSIPIGKGIAGAAAERREAVQICNLQTDDSGVARPDAKKTQVSGSVAIPILHGDDLKGTLGIGKRIPYDFPEDELETLWEIGRRIAAAL